MTAHFILFVEDQVRSTEFYTLVLAAEPRLNVPGMTEFDLGSDAVLGLMPIAGAGRLIGAQHFAGADKGFTPRAELYLIVDSPADHHKRALAAGAREISELSDRDWGHRAAYCFDPDGHVLAFAEVIAG